VPPLLASVTVTDNELPTAVAEQFVNPVPSVTVGEAGTVNPDGNTTVAVSPTRSAPVALELKPAVQVARALAASDVAVNDTAVAAVAEAITTAAAGLTTEVLSADVFTLKLVAAIDPAAGLVKPAIVNAAAVLTGSAQEAPANVTVTVVPEPAPTAVHDTKPVPSVTVGDAGTVNVLANATVTVPPAASAPAELDVNPTVQLDRAAADCGDPVNATLETEGSIVYGNASRASSRRSASIHPPATRAKDQRAPAGVTTPPARS